MITEVDCSRLQLCVAGKWGAPVSVPTLMAWFLKEKLLLGTSSKLLVFKLWGEIVCTYCSILSIDNFLRKLGSEGKPASL
jgi:hypothetical protein